jgi:hypothetical protein
MIICSVHASPNPTKELYAFSAMIQGTRKGGIGIKQRASRNSGCLPDGVNCLKMPALHRDKSFKKGGPKNLLAMSSSLPLAGDTYKAHSFGVRPMMGSWTVGVQSEPGVQGLMTI